jgi:hypothetical protein
MVSNFALVCMEVAVSTRSAWDQLTATCSPTEAGLLSQGFTEPRTPVPDLVPRQFEPPAKVDNRLTVRQRLLNFHEGAPDPFSQVGTFRRGEGTGIS